MAGKAAGWLLAGGLLNVYPKAHDGEMPEHLREAFQGKHTKFTRIPCDVSYDTARLTTYTFKEEARKGDDVRKRFLQIKGFKGAFGITELDIFTYIRTYLINLINVYRGDKR